MKCLLTITMVILFMSTYVFADIYVEEYNKEDGTNVPSHYRTNPNDSKYDNWSSKPNTNPYTGKKGTKNP